MTCTQKWSHLECHHSNSSLFTTTRGSSISTTKQSQSPSVIQNNHSLHLSVKTIAISIYPSTTCHKQLNTKSSSHSQKSKSSKVKECSTHSILWLATTVSLEIAHTSSQVEHPSHTCRDGVSCPSNQQQTQEGCFIFKRVLMPSLHTIKFFCLFICRFVCIECWVFHSILFSGFSNSHTHINMLHCMSNMYRECTIVSIHIQTYT